MSYCRFTTYERGKIEALHQEGYSARKIARILGRNNSSIPREILRNSYQGKYEAQKAQTKYVSRRKSSIPNGKFNSSLKIQIEEKLRSTWSPEQIAML